jgi:hypothetical protein
MAIDNSLFVEGTQGLSFDACINRTLDLIPQSASSVLAANPKRTYAAFINNSEVGDITIVLGDAGTANLGAGIVLKPRGGSFEINQVNLYKGRVSAISSTRTTLAYVEGFTD